MVAHLAHDAVAHGQGAQGLVGFTAAEAFFGPAVEFDGAEQVEVRNQRGVFDDVRFDDRADGHQLPARIADVELIQRFYVGAVHRVGLRHHPEFTAIDDEVIDVLTAQKCLDGSVDRTHWNAELFAFVTVHLHAVGGGFSGKVGENPADLGSLLGFGNEGLHNAIERPHVVGGFALLNLEREPRALS